MSDLATKYRQNMTKAGQTTHHRMEEVYRKVGAVVIKMWPKAT